MPTVPSLPIGIGIPGGGGGGVAGAGAGSNKPSPWLPSGGANDAIVIPSIDCPAPILGELRTQWMDAWMRHGKFGFALLVELSTSYDRTGYTLAIDFADVFSYNIQTWNLRFWNFYNQNNLIVLHSKPMMEDQEDKSSKIIIVEGLNQQKYRKCFLAELNLSLLK